MENSLYAVMAVVGAVVLFVIHRITIELNMRGNSGRIFSRVIGVSALFCLCDAVWGIFASRANPSEYNFFVIASILFHVMATFIAYVWSMYTFSCLDIAIKGVYKVVAFVPFLAAFILILVTLPEGKIFIIDENMAYSSGAYRRILFIIQLGYLFVGMLVTVLTIKKKTSGDIEKRNRFRGMLTYLLFPIASGFLQELYPYAPFYSLGFMLAGVVAFTGIMVREEDIKLKATSRQYQSESKEIYGALEALSKSFVSIHLFDLRLNKQNSVKSTQFIDVFIKEEDDGATQIKKVMQGVSHDSYAARMVEFVDLATLPERMKGRRVISQEFMGKNEGWCMSSFIVVEKDDEDKPTKVIHVVQNIDEAKRREKEYMDALKTALENQNIIYAEMLQAQKNGVVAIDCNDEIVKLNDAAARIFGYSSSSVVPEGMTLERLMKKAGAEVEGEDKKMLFAAYNDAIKKGEPFEYVFYIGEEDNRRYYRTHVNAFEMMDGTGVYIVSQSDITESKKNENVFRMLAETDALTGLNNRGSGENKISVKLLEENHGVFFLFDINKFKQINDNFGHHIGDIALIRVAECLKKAFLRDDIVMRLGGDEFAAFVGDIATEDGVKVCIDKLIELIDGIEIGEAPECKVSISVGAIMLKDAPERSFDCLYKCADTLMYECKASDVAGSKYAIYKD